MFLPISMPCFFLFFGNCIRGLTNLNWARNLEKKITKRYVLGNEQTFVHTINIDWQDFLFAI